MASKTEQGAQRLFFALWPPPLVRAQLQQASRVVVGKKGRAVAGANLHLTLVFLGSVDQAGRQCMEQAADTVRGDRFTLEFSQVGYWSRPRILWLGPKETPPQLEALVTDLVRVLKSCGHDPDARRYQAHLTLARKASRPAEVASIEAIRWNVDRFCLVESITAQAGPIYRVLKYWEFIQ